MSSNHHKHHHSSSEPKSTKLLRNAVAFLLFASLLILSTATCFKAVVINPERIAACLTDYEYSESLYNDVRQFSYDLCDECSIPRECIDEALTLDAVRAVNESYYVGNLCATEQYNPTTYKEKLDALGTELSESVGDYLKNNDIKISALQKENGTADFSQRVTDYLTQIVEFEYIEQFKSITSMGKAVLTVVIVVMAVLSLLLVLGGFAIGKKKYRSIRTFAYSFTAVGIVDFVMVIGVEVIKKIKTLYIFPLYLREAAMNLVNSSIATFAISGFAALAVAIILITIVWKLKRDEK